MRLTSGIASGTKIYSPKGLDTRPALARVRNSLFNILASKLHGKNVLDLFAGTGSIGLEALSIGAGFVVFVDNNLLCAKIIKRNCEKLRFKEQAKIIKCDVFKSPKILAQLGIKYDIVFIDPPYVLYDSGNTRLMRLISELSSNGLSNAGAIFILEHRVKTELTAIPQSVKRVDYRKYGQTALSFYKKV